MLFSASVFPSRFKELPAHDVATRMVSVNPAIMQANKTLDIVWSSHAVGAGTLAYLRAGGFCKCKATGKQCHKGKPCQEEKSESDSSCKCSRTRVQGSLVVTFWYKPLMASVDVQNTQCANSDSSSHDDCEWPSKVYVAMTKTERSAEKKAKAEEKYQTLMAKYRSGKASKKARKVAATSALAFSSVSFALLDFSLDSVSLAFIFFVFAFATASFFLAASSSLVASFAFSLEALTKWQQDVAAATQQSQAKVVQLNKEKTEAQDALSKVQQEKMQLESRVKELEKQLKAKVAATGPDATPT